MGLDKLFPNNILFNEYHLNHLDENMEMQVSGISGSCMMIKAIIFNDIGNFDEQFYLYQEDSDFCLRVIKSGWRVYYVPDAQIIHAGGEGGTKANIQRAIFEWHLSYFKFYRKHYAQDYLLPFNILFYMLMAIKLVLTYFTIPFRK